MNTLDSDNHRIFLKQSLHYWNQPQFTSILKNEIENLDPGKLPLQSGLRRSSYALTDSCGVLILHSRDNEESLLIKCGIFFKGIIAGCSCSDDPSPTDYIEEYCEVLLTINKDTAETSITLLEKE